MKLGWSIRLPGPFYLAGTIWRSRRKQPPRQPRWHGTLTDGWECPHFHYRPDTARDCANRELRRRNRHHERTAS